MVESHIKIRNAIERLSLIVEETKSYLIPCDYDYCIQAIHHYNKLLNEGRFEFNRTKVAWNVFNDRYGSSSIKGFTGEVLATGILNNDAGKVSVRLNSGNKDNEITGVDLKDGELGLQVKTVSSLKSTIKIQPSWLSMYSYRKVHHIVFTCISQRSAVKYSYRVLQRHRPKFIDIKDMKVISLNSK